MTALPEAAPIRDERAQEIISDDALAFLSELHARFNPRRLRIAISRTRTPRSGPPPPAGTMPRCTTPRLAPSVYETCGI